MREDTNRLLSAVLATMREGIMVVNSNMDIILYNNAAASIFKLPIRDPACGVNVKQTPRPNKGVAAAPVQDARLQTEAGRSGRLHRLVDATRDPTINDAFSEVLEKQVAVDVRAEMAGRLFRIYQLHVTPLGNHFAIGIFFDITDLERLERVRREFFSNLSHELRTPLTAILAYTETLLRGALDDPDNSLRFVERLHKHATRINTLISDISDLSAIESGQVYLALGPVRLLSVVTDVLTLTEASRSEKNVTIRVLIPQGLLVQADRTRLEQILHNLIDNAVKFNRAGGSITVAAGERGSEAVVEVEDTGIGIAASDLPRVFERLYRADKSRSHKVEGTGLGLAIVKHLVQSHGGEITASSDIGRGSRFTFTLPLAPGQDQRAGNRVGEASLVDA